MKNKHRLLSGYQLPTALCIRPEEEDQVCRVKWCGRALMRIRGAGDTEDRPRKRRKGTAHAEWRGRLSLGQGLGPPASRK